MFDERLLKDILEVYFALGGVNSELYDEYMGYATPAHKAQWSMTVTTGLISMLGDLLSIAPPVKLQMALYKIAAFRQAADTAVGCIIYKTLNVIRTAFHSNTTFIYFKGGFHVLLRTQSWPDCFPKSVCDFTHTNIAWVVEFAVGIVTRANIFHRNKSVTVFFGNAAFSASSFGRI